MRRINWPFAVLGIILIAAYTVKALFIILPGTQEYLALRVFVEFGLPVSATASSALIFNAFFKPETRKAEWRFMKILFMSMPVVGWIASYIDDLPEGHFDTCAWGHWPITIGGMTAVILQWCSCNHIKEWQRFILFYDERK